jgi:hypothetical protein
LGLTSRMAFRAECELRHRASRSIGIGSAFHVHRRAAATPKNKSKLERELAELADLPPRDGVDASDSTKTVKGGTDKIISPRDPASGLPTGKRL